MDVDETGFGLILALVYLDIHLVINLTYGGPRLHLEPRPYVACDRKYFITKYFSFSKLIRTLRVITSH